MPPETEGHSSIDTLYDIALKVLDNQIQNMDSLDGKIGRIFAFMTLVFGAFITFLTSQSQKLSSILVILFWLAVIIFLAIIVFSVMAYSTKFLRYLARGRPLARFAELGLAEHMIKTYFLERIIEQHEHNEAIVLTKALRVRIVIWLTFADLLVILALIFFQNVSRITDLLNIA